MKRRIEFSVATAKPAAVGVIEITIFADNAVPPDIADVVVAETKRAIELELEAAGAKALLVRDFPLPQMRVS